MCNFIRAFIQWIFFYTELKQYFYFEQPKMKRKKKNQTKFYTFCVHKIKVTNLYQLKWYTHLEDILNSNQEDVHFFSDP